MWCTPWVNVGYIVPPKDCHRYVQLSPAILPVQTLQKLCVFAPESHPLHITIYCT